MGSIAIDTVYLEPETQLYACNTQTFQLDEIKIQNEFSPGLIRAFYTDKKNNVWAAMKKGNIYCKGDRSDVFKWRGNINRENTSGAFYPVYSLYADENDILWAGADVLGLQKAELNRPNFNLSNENIISIL